MFDIGFSELVVIGVVALIVIGPERLPKVARTAGHLYGRMQRYVASVKSDISNEIQLDEIRRAGQAFKQSVESAASGVEQQATVVDDYLRDEVSNIKNEVASIAKPDEGHPVPVSAGKPFVGDQTLQQSLPLDEPDQNVVVHAAHTPTAVVETARGKPANKNA